MKEFLVVTLIGGGLVGGVASRGANSHDRVHVGNGGVAAYHSPAPTNLYGTSLTRGSMTTHNGVVNSTAYSGSSYDFGAIGSHSGRIGSQTFSGSSVHTGGMTIYSGSVGSQPYSGSTVTAGGVTMYRATIGNRPYSGSTWRP